MPAAPEVPLEVHSGSDYSGEEFNEDDFRITDPDTGLKVKLTDYMAKAEEVVEETRKISSEAQQEFASLENQIEKQAKITAEIEEQKAKINELTEGIKDDKRLDKQRKSLNELGKRQAAIYARLQAKLESLPSEEQLAAEAKEIEDGLAECAKRRGSKELSDLKQEREQKMQEVYELEGQESVSGERMKQAREEVLKAERKVIEIVENLNQQEFSLKMRQSG